MVRSSGPPCPPRWRPSPARSAATAWRFSSARRQHGRLAPGRPVLEYRTQQHAVIGALATAHTLRGSARAALAEWAALRDSTPTAPGPGAVMTFSPWAAVDRALACARCTPPGRSPRPSTSSGTAAASRGSSARTGSPSTSDWPGPSRTPAGTTP
ncbi:hypothetical protein [Kitasatospora albolonga]|uniref:acyl-CoA dehydrogenase family protein n=1 Tax=Kitasatospora albolonga TaxID=68173 RepID=UPI003CD0B4CD